MQSKKINLLDLYKEKNLDASWYDNHFSLAKNKFAKFFDYTNTNYRTLLSFKSQFEKFLKLENISREQWEMNSSHGQENDKHRVINMTQSKLFRKNSDGKTYSTTLKGKYYKNFINENFSEEKNWILNFLFLVNGYFNESKNYIVNRVNDEILNYLTSVPGITKQIILDMSKKIFKVNEIEEMLNSDIFYFHSFFDDSDLLTCYLRSSKKDRVELSAYIYNNIKNQTFNCCISNKYKPGGNFNLSMLKDEVRTLIASIFFSESLKLNEYDSFKKFVQSYCDYFKVEDSGKILEYIYKNKDVFTPILEDFIVLEDLVETRDELIINVDIDSPEEYIDETSREGKQKISQIFSGRKKIARIQSDFKCELEKVNNCEKIYFTAKSTLKNYLEVHHLIPQEFRNDFSYSIEVLANYITLCPRCHKQIHLAVDKERMPLVNFLHSNRSSRLNSVNLSINLNDLYKYYKID